MASIQALTNFRTDFPALTSNIDSRWLTLNLPRPRPGDAVALELVPAEILLDVIPGYVQFAIDYPGSGVRVHEVLLLRAVRSYVVATEVDLQRVSGFAVQRGRLVLDNEGIDWLGEENWQMTACLGD